MLLGLTVTTAAGQTDQDWAAQLASWREKRMESLKAEDGWPSVVGLHWLEQGANPAGAAGKIGIFVREGNRVWFDPDPGAQVQIDGQAARRQDLRPDVPGPASLITAGSLTLFVIERGGKLGVRVRDTNSPFRKAFRGIDYFPARPEYRVEARQVRQERKKLSVSTVIDGLTEEMESAGMLEFRLQGVDCRLEAALSGGRLFLIFKDQTSGKTTYPAGRFLYAELPADGRIVLDFNRAINPPCAFTPYATCPLPPAHNKLPVAVEAGELAYHYE